MCPLSAIHHATVAFELLKSVHSVGGRSTLRINGHSLAISDLVRVAYALKGLSNSSSLRPSVELTTDEQTLSNLNSSLHFLSARTSESTYGVTTGFGAAATTRTNQVEALQVSIVEHLLAGVTGFDSENLGQHQPLVGSTMPSEPLGPRVMSESVVRGAILVRLNSLSRGHSAVRIQLLERLCFLLNHSVTPLVPLRGTISASGDLSPLAYVAGTLCAHPDVLVVDRSRDPPQLVKCADSLKSHAVQPLKLGPKEGLAIVNGTAFSAAAAGIATYQAHVLVLLSQVITAMTVEALEGQLGAFHPFIHQVARPHPGQVQVSQTIHRLLKTSRLVDASQHSVQRDLEKERVKQILRQDRYPLRTAPQWLGPQVEDIMSVHQCITTELNCTTDNPLVDPHNGIIHHGGNFQATSVAVSMEKLRLSIAMIGKLIFSQMTELNNAHMNKGLPSCLNGGEPSTNYHTKGLDTSGAAYCAELQSLAAPVTTHVQSAESHNQSVNSLAFISARKTLEAIEVLKLLSASHIYCLCQALELRMIEFKFRAMMRDLILVNLEQEFKDYLGTDSKVQVQDLAEDILDKFWRKREFNSCLDSLDRIRDGMEASIAPLIQVFEQEANQGLSIHRVQNFIEKTVAAGHQAWVLIMERAESILEETSSHMGGTRDLYRHVRLTLGIKFRRGDVIESKVGRTIGSAVNLIVKSMDIGQGIEKVLINILTNINIHDVNQ